MTPSSTNRTPPTGATSSSRGWWRRGTSCPSARRPSPTSRCNARDAFEIGLNFPAKTGYFLDYVRRELIDEYDEATVFGGGLQVRTTLDSEMQRYAEESRTG